MSPLLCVKHTTETTSVVWCRHDTNGVMTVVCNGQTFAGGTVDTAVDDGTAICAVTGLAANTSYAATVYVGGVSIGEVVIKTNPVVGSTFSMAFCSCTSHLSDPLSLQAVLEKMPDLAACVWGGDNIYATAPLGASALWGGTYTENGIQIYDVEDPVNSNPTNQDTTLARLYAHYHLWWSKASYKKMMRSIPNYFQADDHEWPGNNWINTVSPVSLAESLAAANTYYTWATTQQHLTDMNTWCLSALDSYFKGNPSNSHASRDTGRAVDKQLYYDFTIGDAHILCLEDTLYNNDPSSSGTAGRSRYGATQFEWIKSVLAASTKTWKIVFIGKGLCDDYNLRNYDDELQAWVATSGVTGLLMCSGDTHTSGMFWHGFPVLSAGPAGTGANDIPDGYTYYTDTTNGHRWKYLGNYSHQYWKRPASLTGYVKVHGTTKLEYGIIDGAGEIVYSGEMLPGTNEISYPTQRFG